MRFTPGIVAVPRAVVFREPNTNIVPNPEAISGWTMGACVGTANALTDPDGTTLADTLTDNAVGTTGAVSATSTAATNVVAVVYRASVYVKAGTAPWMRFGIVNAGTAGSSAFFNPSTGALGTITGAAVIASGVDAAINGWYRPWYTVTMDAADTTCNFQINMASANGTATVLRDGTKTVHVWLAQLARP